MKTRNMFSILFFLICILIASGCEQNYGKRLEFKGSELYYTSSVSIDEAKRLGNYLVSNGFFTDNNKGGTVQLNKEGGTYEFRMVIKKGLENDQEFIQTTKQIAAVLSNDVFGGKEVDIHLCDDQLKTIRVVVAM